MESVGQKRQPFNMFLLSCQISSLEVKAFHTGLSMVPATLPAQASLGSCVTRCTTTPREPCAQPALPGGRLGVSAMPVLGQFSGQFLGYDDGNPPLAGVFPGYWLPLTGDLLQVLIASFRLTEPPPPEPTGREPTSPPEGVGDAISRHRFFLRGAVLPHSSAFSYFRI